MELLLIISVVLLSILCLVLLIRNSSKKDTIDSLEGRLDYSKERNKWLEDNYTALDKERLALQSLIKLKEEKLKNEIGRNKSVEVRTGQLLEKVAPFMLAFGHNPHNVIHLGMPIDYILFDIGDEDGEIVFIEVKTGQSKLSSKQREIKRLVEEGKVRFEEIRFSYEEPENG